MARARGILAGVALAAGLGASLAPPLAAQPVLDATEKLADDRPEAWAMRWFAAALLPGGYGPATAARPGRVELELEAGGLPRLSERERRVGFGGTKVEDLNRSDAYLRPRLRVGLPAELWLEADWLPPVEVGGAKPNLLSIGLARPFLERERWRAGWRIAAQGGTIEGDFTCPAAEAAAGPDPQANPFGCEAASADEMRLESLVGEAAVAFRPAGAPALELSLAALARRLDATFRVRARYSGIVDRTRLEHSGIDWGLRAGAAWRAGDAWRLAGELAWMPLDVVRGPNGSGPSSDDALLNLRVALSRRLR